MDPDDNNQPGADPMAPAQTPQPDPNQGVSQQPIDVPVVGEAPMPAVETPSAPAVDDPVVGTPGDDSATPTATPVVEEEKENPIGGAM